MTRRFFFRLLGPVLLLAALLLSGCMETTGSEKTSYEKGMEALAANDFMAAMAAFQDTVRVDGEKALGYRGQGIVYLREGNYYNAGTMFSRCLDSLGDTEEDAEIREDVLLYQVEAYRQNGQFDLAREICDELTQVSGREAQALILRGEILAAEGDFASAEADFAAALAIDGSFDNYLRIYESYAAQNRKGDGAELLGQALDIRPRTEADEYGIGRIYYALNEIDAAREHLSIARDGGQKQAGLLLARIALDAGDISGARAVYRSYLDDEGMASMGYNGLVLCDIADQNLRSALFNVEQGLACEDGTAKEMLLFNEVILYEYMLDFETARTKLTAFLQQYPSNQEAVRENLFLQNR